MRLKALGLACVLAAGPLAGVVTAAPASADCYEKPFTAVKITSKKKYRKKADSAERVYNKTKDTIYRTATFETSRTVKVAVTGSYNAEIGGSFKKLITAKVKTSVNADLRASYKIKAGNTDKIKIRPGYYLVATRGWEMQEAKGYVYRVYSNCQTKKLKYFTLRGPWDKYTVYATHKI